MASRMFHGQFIQGRSLGDDREIQTLSHVLPFSPEDTHLNGSFHEHLFAPIVMRSRLERRDRHHGEKL